MTPLVQLWLPILLSAVFVFIASSILHMVIPIHKNDCRKLPGEGKLLDAMNAQNVSPGAYMFPCAASMADMATPEMLEKYNRGPVGFITVLPNGPPAMGKSLAIWFVYSILISVFAAYVAGSALALGAEYLAAFRMTGAVAVLAYAAQPIPDSIWKGQPWDVTAKFIFDGVVYGLVTAGTFGWLWPAAA